MFLLSLVLRISVSGFAARRFFAFPNFFPIFTLNRIIFAILRIILQFPLTIMHIASIMTELCSDAVRKPGHVVTIIWFYSRLSGHTKTHMIFSLLVDILLILLVKYKQK